jgi:hypothetical protein
VSLNKIEEQVVGDRADVPCSTSLANAPSTQPVAVAPVHEPLSVVGSTESQDKESKDKDKDKEHRHKDRRARERERERERERSNKAKKEKDSGSSSSSKKKEHNKDTKDSLSSTPGTRDRIRDMDMHPSASHSSRLDRPTSLYIDRKKSGTPESTSRTRDDSCTKPLSPKSTASAGGAAAGACGVRRRDKGSTLVVSPDADPSSPSLLFDAIRHKSISVLRQCIASKQDLNIKVLLGR